MSKNMGHYDLHFVSYKSTYLRKQALLGLGASPTDDHYDLSVAYAPGVTVVMDPLPGTEPIDRLVEARRRLDALIPDDQVVAGEKIRHRCKAEVNGKLALGLPDEAQKWLRRWGRGRQYEVQLMLDQDGLPFVTVGLPAEEVAEDDPEVRTLMRVVKVDRRCSTCGKGRLRPTGVELTSNPPQYPHACPACGAAENLPDRYPKITHEVDPSGF